MRCLPLTPLVGAQCDTYVVPLIHFHDLIGLVAQGQLQVQNVRIGVERDFRPGDDFFGQLLGKTDFEPPGIYFDDVVADRKPADGAITLKFTWLDLYSGGTRIPNWNVTLV